MCIRDSPDSNIDHRRVPNLETWFTRHDKTRPTSKNPSLLDEKYPLLVSSKERIIYACIKFWSNLYLICIICKNFKNLHNYLEADSQNPSYVCCTALPKLCSLTGHASLNHSHRRLLLLHGLRLFSAGVIRPSHSLYRLVLV